MTLRWLRRVLKNQSGVTLVEILVVVAISGPVAYAVTSSIYNIFSANAADTAHMAAVHEVENAVHVIIPDAAMAQNVSGNLTDVNGLSLAWSNSWTNSTGNATYVVQNGELIRNYSENGTAPKITVVMQHINTAPSLTSSSSTNTTLVFKITSTVSGLRTASETRSFTVQRRITP